MKTRGNDSTFIEPVEPPYEDPTMTATAAPSPFKSRKKPVPSPWRGGWIVRHIAIGVLRVRKEEAKDEAEAIEIFRKRKCGNAPLAQIAPGLRVTYATFRPAETEVGK